MKLSKTTVSAIIATATILAVIGIVAIGDDKAPRRSSSTTSAPTSKPTSQATGRPARIKYAPGRKLAELANKRVRESSGMACSRRYDKVFWTHNDSGDAPRLYAFGADGRDLGAFMVKGASADDWEDLASYTIGDKSFIMIGDVGDNASRRGSCTLYIVAEPKLNLRPAKGAKPTGSVRVIRKLTYVYKDGPVDCESVGVDTVNGKIILLAKRPRRTIYSLPLNPPKGAPSPLVAKPIGTLELGWTTAMDISPDALRAIVLTYNYAYEYVREPKETWARALTRKPRRLTTPHRRQGESICYGRDGKTLYLTSERLPTPLLEIPVAKTPVLDK